MLVSIRPAKAIEAPSRLQLAIREWQRQLIVKAETAPGGRATQTASAGS